ncbi:hypothetical protein CEXT_753601 [Caerostris extrusa]|uniref:Uncharacterized protein n=1 Tax=Caerostris extrusa TaxID=172846 RepID=A0AAV4SU62_CAEEX|nr:hypothetical protein CEXT_753601 [Caerostris extrusa]
MDPIHNSLSLLRDPNFAIQVPTLKFQYRIFQSLAVNHCYYHVEDKFPFQPDVNPAHKVMEEHLDGVRVEKNKLSQLF